MYVVNLIKQCLNIGNLILPAAARVPIKDHECDISVCMSGIQFNSITPQQQRGLYRGGDDDDDEISVSLVEKTGVPGGNHRPTAVNCTGRKNPSIVAG